MDSGAAGDSLPHGPTIRPMPPDGFEWKERYQYAAGELALVHGGKQVAMLMRRADGGWVALLWRHRPFTAPLVSRQCSSFEAGKQGIEAWARRHAERIRREISESTAGLFSGSAGLPTASCPSAPPGAE